MAATVPARCALAGAAGRRSGTARRSRRGWTTPGSLPRHATLVELAIAAVFAAEPRDLSLLLRPLLRRVGAAAGLQPPDQHRPAAPRRSGSSAARSGSRCEMAQQLGKRVQLEQPVRTIRRGKARGRVTTGPTPGRGKRVIVAVPPALAGQIHYQPRLPALRAPARPARPDGLGDQVPWRSTTGRSGATPGSPGRRPRRRAGQAHLRQLAARRQPRRAARLHRGRPGARSWARRQLDERRARGASTASSATSADGRTTPSTTSRRPGRGAVDAAAATSASCRPASWSTTARAARAGRADPLGRHRDRRRSGPATWTARSTPGFASPPRCSPGSATSEGSVPIGTRIGEIGYGSGRPRRDRPSRSSQRMNFGRSPLSGRGGGESETTSASRMSFRVRGRIAGRGAKAGSDLDDPELEQAARRCRRSSPPRAAAPAEASRALALEYDGGLAEVADDRAEARRRTGPSRARGCSARRASGPSGRDRRAARSGSHRRRRPTGTRRPRGSARRRRPLGHRADVQVGDVAHVDEREAEARDGGHPRRAAAGPPAVRRRRRR